MTEELLLVVYCLLVGCASFAGGVLPGFVRITHSRMQLIISLVGGLMLGVALVHMLPHSLDGTGSLDVSIAWMIAGLLCMFFMLRAFHFHHHGPIDPGVPLPAHAHSHDHDHDRRHDHDHSHDDDPRRKSQTARALRWVGMLIGLTVHTILDGMALAASVTAEAHGNADATGLFGFGTFLAVALHKPVDSMSITSLMRTSGAGKSWVRNVNLAYAVMCPLGAGLFWLGIEAMPAFRLSVIGAAVAFSAGLFLAISLSDLLPEIQFHSHERWKLSGALVAGVIISYLIGYFEPPHTHAGAGHGHGSEAESHGGHADHGHDHDSEPPMTKQEKPASDHEQDHSGHDHDHDK